MFYSCCQQSGKSNPFTSGCINYRISTLVRHIESQDHRNALQEIEMAESFQEIVMNSVSSQEQAVVSGMRTVYWLPKEYIATEKYNSLMNLLKLQGCKDIENLNVAKNTSDNSVRIAVSHCRMHSR